MRLRPSTRLGFLAVAVVALCAAAASYLGYDPSAGVPTTRTASLDRTLSCVNDIGGFKARQGALGDGASGVTATPDGRVHFTAQAAPNGYAVRWGASPNNVAAAACPEPRAEWWFVGAGSGVTHHSILTLDNPRTADAVVDIDVLGQVGVVAAPGLRGVHVPKGGSVRFDLAEVAPAVGDLAVHVTAARGLVAASVQERWATDAASKPVNLWVADQPPAATQSTLLGIPEGANHATLLVANPSRDNAVVSLKVAGKAGTFAPTAHASVQVAPMTLSEISLDDVLSVGPRALIVSSQVPVSAGIRSLKGTTASYATALQPFAPASVVALPDGVTGQLVLVGGARSANLKVEQFDDQGNPVGATDATVATNASLALPLAANARIVRVTGTADDVRGVVLADAGAGGVSALPLLPTASEAHLPVVEPGWTSWR